MKTFGTLSFQDGKWHIKAEPHVLLRAKRVFGRMDKNQHDVVSLVDTIDVARDLEWFLDRYPLAFDPPAVERRLKKGANKHRERASLVEQILSRRTSPREFELAEPARDYQKAGAELILATGGTLIADDMGLGKTVLFIAALTDPRTRPALIVVPKALQRQWARQIKRFAPTLTVHTLQKSTPYDLSRGKRVAPEQQQLPLAGTFPDVILSTYAKLSGWASTLGAGLLRSVWYDEAQELRTGDSSAKGQAARHLSASVHIRAGATGTPIYNYGSEMYNVLECIRPGALGTQEEFNREWCDGWSEKVADPKAFGTFLRNEGLMLRRTRADVGRELPALSRVFHDVDSDADVIDDIEEAATQLANVILREGPESFMGERMKSSGELSYLVRQATGLSKAPHVADFVRMIVESGEPVVLFGWHHAVYQVWMERLKEFNPVKVTGEETDKQKDEALQAFIQGRSKVIIISLRSAAGLDGLQFASCTVVHGELDWSPGVHEQCLSADTEVLTPTGWASHDTLATGHEVAAFDIATGSIRYVPVLGVVRRPLAVGEKMYSAINDYTDLRVTGGHRMIVEDGDGWKFETAAVASRRSQKFRMPCAGIQESAGVPLTDPELELLGWYLTDGSFNARSRQLVICQSEDSPHNADIVRCLQACGMKYGVSRTEAGKGSQFKRRSAGLRYCVPKYGTKGGQAGSQGYARLEQYFDKDLSPLLAEVTPAQLDTLLRAMHYGDGRKAQRRPVTDGTRSYSISTGRPLLVERLQSLCIRRGWRCNVSTRKTPAGAPFYEVNTKPVPWRAFSGANYKTGLQECPSVPGENVWCVTTELGTIVTRRNGKATIVGNCDTRVFRDGQTKPVIAYYLTCDDGSDPIVSTVLRQKGEQLEGIRDPDAEFFERLQTTDPDRLKSLAEAFLNRRARSKEVA